MKYTSIGKSILKLYVQGSLLRELRELQIPRLIKFNLVLNCFNFKGTMHKNDELLLIFFFFKVARHYDMHFKQGSFYFWKLI